MSLLRIISLGKSYEGKKILLDISVELEQGQTLSVIGSSGSGKTTLLRCINFLEKADEGTIQLNQETIYDASRDKELKEKELVFIRRHFGLVFQQFNLFPQYTALENVMLASRLRGSDVTEKAIALLNQMGLCDRMDYYPHQLSGGQQQRVAIARALALDPDVLCFDEPTSALDPLLTGEVLKVIRQLSERNMTMIIVTHEIAFAGQISDRIIFMDEGRIIEAGDASLIDDPQDERTKRFLS